MVDIPPQLHQHKLRFVKVLARQKRAFEDGWQKDSNYSFDSKELQAHLKSGGNYGVLGGVASLVIVDCDHPELVTAVESNLPPTFTVASSHGKHFYFFCPDLDKPIRLIDNGHTNVGDVQFTGKYVVGPGSIHPSGKTYTIVNDLQISTISKEQLNLTLSKWMRKPKPATHKKELGRFGLRTSELEIDEVMDTAELHQQGDELQGSHPIHGSTTGLNFRVNLSKNLWHCFRHNTGGNAFTWLAVKEGIIDCSEATAGCLRGSKFIDVLKIARDRHELSVMIPTVSVPQNFDKLIEETLAALLARKRDTATELVVRSILNENYIYTIRSDEKPEMWIYNEGVYVPQAKTFINEYCYKVLGKSYTTNFSNLVTEKIRAQTYIEAELFFVNEHKKEVAVQNGILNIFTRELSEFTPEKRFFNKLPVTFDSDAECEAVDNHFKAILKRESDIAIMYELFGYFMLKDYPIEKAFMFVGNGRNGKSKTLDLMKRFLGPENCSSIPLQQFENDPYSVSELHGKFANLSGDIDKKALRSTGMFKTLTGRDMVSANRKYLSRLNFVNYAKMVFCANELPYTYDKTLAFFDRWIIVEFPYTFVDQEEYDNATDKKMLKVADKLIISKISTPAELSGLLNKSLAGLARLSKNKAFSYTESRSEVETFWRRKSSSFSAFVMDCVVEDWDHFVSKAEFRRAYSLYCRKYKLRPASDKMIKSILGMDYGVIEEQKKIGDEGNRERCWVGIRLKSEEHWNKGLTLEDVKKLGELGDGKHQE